MFSCRSRELSGRNFLSSKGGERHGCFFLFFSVPRLCRQTVRYSRTVCTCRCAFPAVYSRPLYHYFRVYRVAYFLVFLSHSANKCTGTTTTTKTRRRSRADRLMGDKVGANKGRRERGSHRIIRHRAICLVLKLLREQPAEHHRSHYERTRIKKESAGV